MPPRRGTAVHMAAANLLREGSAIFAECSVCRRAQSQQSNNSLTSPHVPLCSGVSEPRFVCSLFFWDPRTARQPWVAQCRHTPAPSEKHPENTARCTNTSLWEKLLITNTITATTDQKHDLIPLWCASNQDYLKLCLCVSFPIPSHTMLFHTYFCAAVNTKVGYALSLSCATLTGVVAVK